MRTLALVITFAAVLLLFGASVAETALVLAALATACLAVWTANVTMGVPAEPAITEPAITAVTEKNKEIMREIIALRDHCATQRLLADVLGTSTNGVLIDVHRRLIKLAPPPIESWQQIVMAAIEADGDTSDGDAPTRPTSELS